MKGLVACVLVTTAIWFVVAIWAMSEIAKWTP